MLTRKRVLAAKLETAVGTTIALAAADGAMNVFDAIMQPTAEFIERMGQSAFSPLPGVVGARSGTVSFSVEINGSGVTENIGGESVPAWAETFLPACGMVNTLAAKNIFTPLTGAPGVADYGWRTLTIGVYIDGTLRTLSGCMGNARFIFPAGGIACVEFTFTGIWEAPTTVAIITPDYPVVPPNRFAGSTFVLDEDAAAIVAELTVDLGNEVVLREDGSTAGKTSGFNSAVITGRRITGTIDLEGLVAAQTLTHTNWLAIGEQAVAWVLNPGTDIGNEQSFAAPKLQFTNLQEGDRNGIVSNNIEFQLNRSADLGDDEFTITFT